jgi:hypothetical protein
LLSPNVHLFAEVACDRLDSVSDSNDVASSPQKELPSAEKELETLSPIKGIHS